MVVVRWHVVYFFTHQCNLKAEQMNVKRIQIREHKAVVANEKKNIYCAKGDGAVDRSTVTKWFQKFRRG